MTARPSEHNCGPQLVDRTFKRRWAQTILSRPDKPVGAVAVAFKLYIDSDIYGRGAAATDAEIARATGASDRSVRNFKAWLVREHFVQVVVRGGRGGKSEFICTIPGENAPAVNRQNLPVKAAIQPATISGKNRLNRQNFPVDEPVQPAASSGQGENPVYPAPISGKNRQGAKERSPHTPLKENNKYPQGGSITPRATPWAEILNPEVAAAAADVRWTSDGRIEVFNGFKAELKETFPDVNLTDGLAIVAGECVTETGPAKHGLTLMTSIRRRFGYLQNEHRGRDKRSGKAPKRPDDSRDDFKQRMKAQLAEAARLAQEVACRK